MPTVRLPVVRHFPKLFQFLAHLFLFGIFLRSFVEIAERPVHVPVGIGRSINSFFRSGTSTASVATFRLDLRFVECRHFFRLLFPRTEHRRQILHLFPTLILLAVEQILLVSRLFVTHQRIVSRCGNIGIETGLSLLFLLFGRCEYQPHHYGEDDEHKRIDNQLLLFLPLFFGQFLFGLVRLFGRLHLVFTLLNLLPCGFILFARHRISGLILCSRFIRLFHCRNHLLG